MDSHHSQTNVSNPGRWKRNCFKMKEKRLFPTCHSQETTGMYLLPLKGHSGALGGRNGHHPWNCELILLPLHWIKCKVPAFFVPLGNKSISACNENYLKFTLTFHQMAGTLQSPGLSFRKNATNLQAGTRNSLRAPCYCGKIADNILFCTRFHFQMPCTQTSQSKSSNQLGKNWRESFFILSSG